MSTSLILTKLVDNTRTLVVSAPNTTEGIASIQTELASLIQADKLVVDATYAAVPGYSSTILYNNDNMDACIQVNMDSPISINGFTAPRTHTILQNFYLTQQVTLL